MKRETFTTETLSEISAPLLQWYTNNKRQLPWRKNTEPYRVWVSEIMLQQTRVEAVKPYYHRFLENLPDVSALANAPEDILLKLWEGLGYYNRVRNMQKAAKIIADEYKGVFPNTYNALIQLPGIGHYTAGAIASISFGEPVPAVDGNVLRVITRLLGLREDITQNKTVKNIQALLTEKIDRQFPGDYNQALMELGATVCLPTGIAKCEICPLQNKCTAFWNDSVLELPVKTPKKPRRLEDKTVFMLLNEQNEIAISKRGSKGLLANLYELPNCEGLLNIEQARDYLLSLGFQVVSIEKNKKAKHIFTHIEWHMLGYLVSVKNFENAPFTFVNLTQLEKKHSLPSAFSSFKGELVAIISAK